jgi:hypothetical protein
VQPGHILAGQASGELGRLGFLLGEGLLHGAGKALLQRSEVLALASQLFAGVTKAGAQSI